MRPEDPWFAIQVWAGREHSSKKHLAARGYDVFLPSRREARTWSDRRKQIETALFAGYLFCRVGEDGFSGIVTAPGVVRVVGNRAGPVAVDTTEIETLQTLVSSRVALEPWERLVIGRRVRIEAGPLTGAEGVVLVVKNQRRLIASVSLLQRMVAVELDAAWVSTPFDEESDIGMRRG